MRLGWCWFSIAVSSASHSVVDLSKPFATASSYNDNPIANALASARNKNILGSSQDVLGYVLLNSEGEVLAEYNKPGIAASDPYSVHAVTKSWIAVLICMLIDARQLLLSTTLGEVWPGTEWPDGVIDAAQKQRITIAELLSMTSGLHEPQVCRPGGSQTSSGRRQ